MGTVPRSVHYWNREKETPHDRQKWSNTILRAHMWTNTRHTCKYPKQPPIACQEWFPCTRQNKITSCLSKFPHKTPSTRTVDAENDVSLRNSLSKMWTNKNSMICHHEQIWAKARLRNRHLSCVGETLDRPDSKLHRCGSTESITTLAGWAQWGIIVFALGSVSFPETKAT